MIAKIIGATWEQFVISLQLEYREVETRNGIINVNLQIKFC